MERYGYEGWEPAKPSPLGTENFDVWVDLDGSNAVKMRRGFSTGFDHLSSRTQDDGTFAGVYLTDLQGSIISVVNRDGDINGTRSYDAFGNITAEDGKLQGDRYAYTGREWDAFAQLQYNRARMYDPAVGRWYSADPMSFAAGDANLYRYVGNFVTGATDPSGLIFFPLFGGPPAPSGPDGWAYYDGADGSMVPAPATLPLPPKRPRRILGGLLPSDLGMGLFGEMVVTGIPGIRIIDGQLAYMEQLEDLAGKVSRGDRSGALASLGSFSYAAVEGQIAPIPLVLLHLMGVPETIANLDPAATDRGRSYAYLVDLAAMLATLGFTGPTSGLSSATRPALAPRPAPSLAAMVERPMPYQPPSMLPRINAANGYANSAMWGGGWLNRIRGTISNQGGLLQYFKNLAASIVGPKRPANATNIANAGGSAQATGRPPLRNPITGEPMEIVPPRQRVNQFDPAVPNPAVPTPETMGGRPFSTWGADHVRWGTGPEGALDRITTITRQELVQQEITRDQVIAAREYYLVEFRRNVGNPTAAARVQLMDHLLTLLP